MIYAPWTDEQVQKLNEYQTHSPMHPFTCIANHAMDGNELVATNDGWICLHCEYTQNWAHSNMFNGSFKLNLLRETEK